MHIVGAILGWISLIVGAALIVVVALQTSKSEGLSGILAGGGGGGGKVGRERGLDKTSVVLCYSWLALSALAALVRHRLS